MIMGTGKDTGFIEWWNDVERGYKPARQANIRRKTELALQKLKLFSNIVAFGKSLVRGYLGFLTVGHD